MSNSNEALEAFKAGANAAPSDLNGFILSLVFVALLLVTAYSLMNAYEDLTTGNSSVTRFLWLAVRWVLLYCILGYFLLH